MGLGGWRPNGEELVLDPARLSATALALIAFAAHKGGPAQFYRPGMAAWLRSKGDSIQCDPGAFSEFEELRDLGLLTFEDTSPETKPPISFDFRLTELGSRIGLALPVPDAGTPPFGTAAFGTSPYAGGVTSAAPAPAERVFGEDAAGDWYEQLPERLPLRVRTAAECAHATEGLRRIQDRLAEVMPAASGVEREFIEQAVFGSISDAIDALNLVSPPATVLSAENAGSGVLDRAYTLVRLAIRILEKFPEYKEFVRWLWKLIEALLS